MSARRTTEYEAVLKTVSAWDQADRYALVQDVLETLTPESDRARRRRQALRRLEGMLGDVEPIPTDADITQWLVEERMKKYG